MRQITQTCEINLLLRSKNSKFMVDNDAILEL